jgi:NAD(P)-dependent dehydrogenase (short-subunit alcohol dehydrogenase family)
MRGAIVIGAGPGIGLAVARRFAREGLPVAAIARSAATVDATVAAVAAEGGTAAGFTADATDDAGLRAALDAAVARHGVPEVLVYNAARIRPDRPGELPAADLLATWAVNVGGAATAAAHLAPRMAAAGGGTIVLTGGMPEPVAAYASLSLGKAGVRTLAALLAEEHGPAGIHVATVTVHGPVAPGTRFDPDEIADRYWTLHRQPRDAWDLVVDH